MVRIMKYIWTDGKSRIDGKVGLLKNVPQVLLNKLNTVGFENIENNIVELVIISGDSVDKVRQFVDNLGGTYEDLGYGFGIINVNINKITDILTSDIIQYIEIPLNLVTTDSQSNRAACVQQAQTTFNLDGSGVLIGFIDSGIDYTHPAFRNEDGTTRIEYIYDLSGNGSIYDKEKINEALKSKDPFSVVNVVDLTEHGTHVAGIACAGGKIPIQYYGVAPKSSIAMVKAMRGRFTLSTQIMRGIKFLSDKSKELRMPLVVNMSLSTNEGAHNGSSLLEKYIQTVASLERATIVIAAGNEGEAAHHVQGRLDGEKNIDINIAIDEQIVILNLYKDILPMISIEIINPIGESSGEIAVAQGYKDGGVGLDRFVIYTTGPKPFDLSGEIIIALTTFSEYLTAGRWRLIIKLKNQYTGSYDIWLPISEALNPNTKFLQPSVLNTLGIPATVNNIIAVGSYNYLTNTISSFSGRGEEVIEQYIRPDVVAPGENITSAVPDRRFDSKSGTSMATPHVTGIVALLMQWGVVKGNDLYLYGERLKYYLVQGAKRTRNDIKYPDPSWGYGAVCANDSLEIVRRTVVSARYSNNRQQIEGTNVTSVVGNDTENSNLFENKVSLFVEIPSEEVFNEILKIPGVTGVLLGSSYGLLIFPPEKYNEIESLATKLVLIDIPEIFTTSAISPVEASGAPIFTSNPYLNLTGRGVLVGIIDTGIDYLNQEFLREDNTSRIFRLWDQTLQPTGKVLDIEYGREFTEEQINEAINIKLSGGDPYTKVPSKDTIGHGTMVAGVIGGRGKNLQLIGAAPDCDFIIVKLETANKLELDSVGIDTITPCYVGNKLLLAARYISIIANKYKRPVVIYLPLGTNLGPHNGVGIIDNFAEVASRQIGTVIVTSTGNQGDTETHTEGRFTNNNEIKTIEIRVGKNQKSLPIQIWVNAPDTVNLSIISPSGEVIENLITKLTRNTKIKFVYEGTEMLVDIKSPEKRSGDTLISIKATKLKEGIWKFRLTDSKVVDGRYYAWIPQRELLDSETRFLSPSESTTLTIPSSGSSLISVAYYNQNNNSIVAKSGRGFTRDNRVKPDIAAGGVDAVVTQPGGGSMVASGSSIAGAVVAGGCALILQWGVVEGNVTELYASSLRTYIIRGAKQRMGDIYPNPEWGYGMFDLEGVFNAIRESSTRGEIVKNKIFDEYEIRGLFIRKPHGL